MLEIVKLELEGQKVVPVRLVLVDAGTDIIPTEPKSLDRFRRLGQGVVELRGHPGRQRLPSDLLPSLSAHRDHRIANSSTSMPLQPLTSFAPLAAWFKARRTRLLALFVCVLVPLFLFGELAENIRESEPFAFDEAILRFMQHRANPILDRLMLLASAIGSGPVVGIVDVAVWLLLLVRRRWLDALLWALATGGAALLNQLAKHSYERIRPELWPSIAPETSFSFPSGHAMQSTALAAALLVLLWPTAARIPAMVGGVLFALLVGISRVYLGVHYPSDVLAGWAASIAWVAGLSFLFHRHAFRPGPSMPRTTDSSILARPPSRGGDSPPP